MLQLVILYSFLLVTISVYYLRRSSSCLLNLSDALNLRQLSFNIYLLTPMQSLATGGSCDIFIWNTSTDFFGHVLFCQDFCFISNVLQSYFIAVWMLASKQASEQHFYSIRLSTFFSQQKKILSVAIKWILVFCLNFCSHRCQYKCCHQL